MSWNSTVGFHFLCHTIYFFWLFGYGKLNGLSFKVTVRDTSMVVYTFL